MIGNREGMRELREGMKGGPLPCGCMVRTVRTIENNKVHTI